MNPAQPKAPKKRRDHKPILFTSSPTKSSAQDTNDASIDTVPLIIKLVEINILKAKLKEKTEEAKSPSISSTSLKLYNSLVLEMNITKSEHRIRVKKEDIQCSKYLKSNFLPEENIVEVA